MVLIFPQVREFRETMSSEGKAEVVYVADTKLLRWCDAVPVFSHRVGGVLGAGEAG